MINSTNVPAQTVITQATIPFATDRVRSNRSNACCGGWLSHDVGDANFTLTNRSRCCSVFEVQFNTNLSSATVGALALVLQADGVAISGTEMDYTPATASVYESVSASTLVKVPPCASTTISVKNISASSVLVKDTNIIIKKVA